MQSNKIVRTVMGGVAGALLVFGPSALLTNNAPLSIVQPANAGSLRVGIFFDSLAPHGTWADHRRYGYVFVPNVRSGWRPYVYGHWVYSDLYGWYWDSEEPFAWAVYHYGRWDYDPAYGWIWIPGNVWAPAWVTWRYGGDYVGWAPIGPHGTGYIYGTPDYYEPPIAEAWVFVPAPRFLAFDIVRYVVPVVEINVVLRKASERHRVSYRNGKVFNPFLPRNRAQQIVKQPINIYNVNKVDDPSKASRAARRGQAEIRTFSPEISDEKPEKKPNKVAKRPDEVKSRPVLKELVKGKKPEDSPPSAAELKTGPRPVQTERKSEAKDRIGPIPAEPKPNSKKLGGEKQPDEMEQKQQVRTKGGRVSKEKRMQEDLQPLQHVQPRGPGKSKNGSKSEKSIEQTQPLRPGQPKARIIDSSGGPDTLPKTRQRGNSDNSGPDKEFSGPPSQANGRQGHPSNRRGDP